MLTFRHFESFSLSLFVVITLVVCSLEVLVDVGERGGAQVVVGHGLNEAFSEIINGKHPLTVETFSVPYSTATGLSCL